MKRKDYFIHFIIDVFRINAAQFRMTLAVFKKLADKKLYSSDLLMELLPNEIYGMILKNLGIMTTVNSNEVNFLNKRSFGINFGHMSK